MSLRLRSTALSVALALFVLPAVWGLPVQTIPEGVDVVAIINNQFGTLIQEGINTCPMVPPPVKDQFNNMTKAFSFNPLTDLNSVQIMGNINEKSVAIVAQGKFDCEKLMAQLKVMGEKEMTATKIGTLDAVQTKDGKAAICFVDAGTAIAGKPDLVKAYVEAAAAKKTNPAFASLLAKVNEKAYVVFMAVGDALGKKLIAKMEQKQARRPVPPAQAAIRDAMMKHFFGDVTGKWLFAQQTDDKFEMYLVYDRPEKKDCTYHLVSENDDPKARIDASIKEFLKVIATLPALPAKDDGKNKPAPKDDEKGKSKNGKQDKQDDNEDDE